MPSGTGEQEFERALTPEVYSAAWRYCCRLSRCREDAEDLLQEALARAYLRFDQLRRSASFKPWLLRIVYRSYLMGHRVAQRRPQAAPTEREPVSAGGTAAVEHDVQLALAGLPESQRQLLVLVYMEGLAPQEAAQVLEIRPAAVRQRLLRARRALKRQLMQDPGRAAPEGMPRSTRR